MPKYYLLDWNKNNFFLNQDLFSLRNTLAVSENSKTRKS